MLNLEGEGKPLCRIIGCGKGKKKASKLIFVTDDENNVINAYKFIRCKDDERLQQIPNFNAEREVLYISGMPGSGKSYYLKNYAKQYNIVFPDRPIYILSTINEDPSLEGIKNAKRINIFNPEFVTTELNAEDFRDSIVVFDDTDTVKDKLVRKKLDHILSELINVGRHTNTSVIYVSHIATNGASTKEILMGANHIIFFVKGMGKRALDYLLINYLNLDKKQVEEIRQLKSRHVCISKTYPITILYDRGVYVLD